MYSQNLIVLSNNIKHVVMKKIPWQNRSNLEILKIKKQSMYTKSTRTFYPRIKFRYGYNKKNFNEI